MGRDDRHTPRRWRFAFSSATISDEAAGQPGPACLGKERAKRMVLSPVRRRGFPALRAALRWRPLLWTLGGSGAGAALAQLPGGQLWRLLVVVGAGTIAVGAIGREDRRLRDAEQLHRRPPRVTDLDRAPVPSTARQRRARRLLVGVAVADASLLLGMITFAGWALTGGLSDSDYPHWLPFLLVPVGLLGLGADLRRMVRTLRRFPHPAGLARSVVTVLGFSGRWQLEVVFVPGVLPVADLLRPVPPGTPERPDLPTAFVAQLGWHLGEVIPGDVLVCDGEPVEGAVVALATDERTDWTTALAVLPWSEIQSPSLRQIAVTAWREGAEQGRERPRGVGRGGRRVAVRKPDGSLSVPGPGAGRTPPWGEAR